MHLRRVTRDEQQEDLHDLDLEMEYAQINMQNSESSYLLKFYHSQRCEVWEHNVFLTSDKYRYNQTQKIFNGEKPSDVLKVDSDDYLRYSLSILFSTNHCKFSKIKWCSNSSLKFVSYSSPTDEPNSKSIFLSTKLMSFVSLS